MRRHQNWLRRSIELLEGRDVPTNLTATFDPASHTLSIKGDGASNQLQILAVVGDTTRFVLRSPTDTINNRGGDYQSATGVQIITIKMLDGDDSITVNNANGPVSVTKNLTINGGAGANAVTATDLNVRQNFSIVNGTNTTGADANILTHLTVGGSLAVNNGDGDTTTVVNRSTAGLSFVQGSINVTNGVGKDATRINDTNVGGNVSVRNGEPNSGNVAGSTRIYNNLNTTARSLIGGNVSVSYIAGNADIWDGIWDTEVLGNVTYNHGSGNFTTYLDGFATTNLPVKIGGNLTLTGTGANQIFAGSGWDRSGIKIGGAFNVIGGSANDSVTMYMALVGKATQFNLGNGVNAVTIDDSDFGGTFTLICGSGADTVSVDTTTATTQATTFTKNVLMYLGDGADTLTRAGPTDINQRIVFYRSFVVHHGPGADVNNLNLAREISPFGSSIQWVV
jgi:hypothetical protein